MQYNGTSYTQIVQLVCNHSFNYHICVSDKASNTIKIGNTGLRSYWGPVIIETDVEYISENELNVWANVSHWGSGVAEVLLEYEFIPYEGSVGVASAIKQLETSVMDFNGSVYLTTLTFQEDGTFTWRIIARDSLNQFRSLSSTNELFFNFITKTPELIPLLVAVGVIPVVLIFFSLMVNRKRQTRILTKRRKQEEILDRSSDIFSLRVIICRNHSGLTFYTENFVGGGQDEDMIAGLTTAISGVVTDISKRKINSGEFDTLEREGFSVLSYHGDYTTLSLISEEKLSSFIRLKMKELSHRIESQITEEELNVLITPKLRDKAKKLVYELLPVGLLRPLTFDNELLAQKMNHFKKNEQKWFKYVEEVPSFIDAQLVFYAMTFITSLTVHGIPLVKAFRFLEDCYNLGVIRNLSEAEMRFFGQDFHSTPNVLTTEE